MYCLLYTSDAADDTPCVIHILSFCVLFSTRYCFAPRAHLCILSPLDYWCASFWQVQVPYTKSQFQRFRVYNLLGRANTFSFLFLLLTPRKSLSVPPLSPCFLTLAFPLCLILSFTSVLCPPNLSMYLFLVSSCILPYFSRLRYPT